MPYDFTYFILICKLYKSEKPQTRKKKKKQQQKSGGSDEPEIVWSNPEEEIINQVWETSLEGVLCCSTHNVALEDDLSAFACAKAVQKLYCSYMFTT
jgi:hypothetical protein